MNKKGSLRLKIEFFPFMSGYGSIIRDNRFSVIYAYSKSLIKIFGLSYSIKSYNINHCYLSTISLWSTLHPCIFLKVTINIIIWLVSISNDIIPPFLFDIVMPTSPTKRTTMKNKNIYSFVHVKRITSFKSSYIDKNLQFFYILLTSLFKRIYYVYILLSL